MTRDSDLDIPNQPLVDRKKKQHTKKVKKSADSSQRFNKVQRKRQMANARIRDMEEEMEDWY